MDGWMDGWWCWGCLSPNKITFYSPKLGLFSDNFIRSRLSFCLTSLSHEHFIELAVFISVNTKVSAMPHPSLHSAIQILPFLIGKGTSGAFKLNNCQANHLCFLFWGGCFCGGKWRLTECFCADYLCVTESGKVSTRALLGRLSSGASTMLINGCWDERWLVEISFSPVFFSHSYVASLDGADSTFHIMAGWNSRAFLVLRLVLKKTAI